MTRPLQRGSSTSRFAEDGWSHEETPVVLQTNGKDEGDCHGKASLLMLLSAALKRGLSFQKFQQKAGEDGLESGSHIPETGMSADVFALKSLLGCCHSDKSFFTQLPDVSSLCFNTSNPNASFGFSIPVQNKRGLLSPLAKIIMLSFISIFVLVAVVGSISAGYSTSSAPRLIYSSYRRFQEDFSSLDLASGGIFGLGALHPKELMICPKDMEHHVPCYNVSLAIESGLRNGEEYDRHCESSKGRKQCLIRPPKDYSLPLQWPHSKNAIWSGNIKAARDFKEARTERIMLGEDNMLTFESQGVDGVEMHFQKIAALLGCPDDNSFSQVGIRTVLEIGCNYGSFVAHLLSRNFVTLCVAPYEPQKSQVQLALDRGLPAMIGSLVTRQLPYPASSFNMIHCADCGIDWSQKDGLLLLEVDRLLTPDGYFVWTPPITSHGKSSENIASEQKSKSIDEAAKSMCWASFRQQDRAFVWRKTADRICSKQSSDTTLSICDDDENSDVVAYRSLRHCLAAAKDGAFMPGKQLYLPSSTFGFSSEELSDDSAAWSGTVKSYWSSITPLLFSDHPKRPAEDDPLPPPNILRNVMDMNALYGGFNAALLQVGKSVWVMNVIPTSGPNTLPIIYKRGLIGALHNWCEAFPTYPRTYDLLHAIGLLSQQVKHKTGCGLSTLFLEMDRILRPEGWVLLRDGAELIEEARVAASQMRWESRVIEVEGDSNLRLLVCQKVFLKR